VVVDVCSSTIGYMLPVAYVICVRNTAETTLDRSLADGGSRVQSSEYVAVSYREPNLQKSLFHIRRMLVAVEWSYPPATSTTSGLAMSWLPSKEGEARKQDHVVTVFCTIRFVL
jgi:hypothetical protein